MVAIVATTFTVAAKSTTVTGRVLCEGKGVAGVVVSDGYNVVATDASGAFALPTDVEVSQFVNITVPSGYEVERKGNAPQFYGRIDSKATGVQNFDFNLTKVDQSEYTIITFADTHVTGPKNTRACHLDQELYLTQYIPAVNEYAAKQSGRVYVMTLGDMTQAGYRPQERNNFEGYSLANFMEDTKVDLPVFNAVGNHDHNNSPKGTVLTESTTDFSRIDYYKDLGPAWYSVNIGREHYVFVDNTFVLTQESHPTYDEAATKGYQVRLSDAQQAWLEKDIAMVDKSQIDRIVVMAHCPVLNGRGGLQMMRAPKFFAALKGYEVVILVGHSHCDRTVVTTINGNKVYEFINPSGAGTAWYTPLNTDGTPGAAVAYKFKAGEKAFAREFVTYGEIKEKNIRYRVYDNVANKWSYPIMESTGHGWSRQHDLQNASYKDKPAIMVTIWGAHTITFTESTGGTGKVVKSVYDLAYRDWYWNYYERSLNGEFPYGQTLRKASWQTPGKTGEKGQLYVPADPKAVVTVEAKDAFGKVIAKFTAQAAE